MKTSVIDHTALPWLHLTLDSDVPPTKPAMRTDAHVVTVDVWALFATTLLGWWMLPDSLAAADTRGPGSEWWRALSKRTYLLRMYID